MHNALAVHHFYQVHHAKLTAMITDALTEYGRMKDNNPSATEERRFQAMVTERLVLERRIKHDDQSRGEGRPTKKQLTPKPEVSNQSFRGCNGSRSPAPHHCMSHDGMPRRGHCKL